MTPPLRLLRGLFFAYLAAGPIAVAALLLALPPLRLGDGTLAALGRAIESFDLRWALVGAASLVWLGVLSLGLVAWRVRAAGLETSRLRNVVSSLLEGRSIPVHVEVSGTVPLRMPEPFTASVAVDTSLALDQEIEVDAEVPVKVVLPIDVVVETSILRLGTIKIPIRASVPLDLIVPLRAPVRLRAPAIPVRLQEMARVSLPPLDVPVSARVDARLDLAANARKLEEHLFSRDALTGRSADA